MAQKTGFTDLLIFCLPRIPYSLLVNILALAPQVYSQQYGFDLIVLGTALAAVRVFDAVIDPLIGYLSDRYRTRWGRRKPWVLVGSVFALLPGAALFLGLFELSVLSFILWYVFLAVFMSMFQVTKLAWSVDLTDNPQDRVRFYFLQQCFSYGGAIIFLALPWLLAYDSKRLTPDVLEAAFYVIVALLPITVFLLLAKIPERHDTVAADGDSTVEPTLSGMRDIYRVFSNNGPFLYFTVVRVIAGLGLGIASGVGFLFFDGYLGLGEHFSLIGLAAMGVGISITALGTFLAARFDRILLYSFAGFVGGASGVGMFLLTPETDGLLLIYLLLSGATTGALVSIAGSLSYAFFADVTDYGRLVCKTDAAGLYFSVAGTIEKLELALAGGLGLVIIGSFGFDAKTGAENTAMAETSLRAVAALIPGICALLSALLMLRFPLNGRRQAIISRRLALLEERSSRAAGAPI